MQNDLGGREGTAMLRTKMGAEKALRHPHRGKGLFPRKTNPNGCVLLRGPTRPRPGPTQPAPTLGQAKPKIFCLNLARRLGRPRPGSTASSDFEPGERDGAVFQLSRNGLCAPEVAGI